MNRSKYNCGAACLAAASLLAIGQVPATLAAGAAGSSDWPGYGRAADEQRFAPSTQIRRDNIQQLGLAWNLDLPREARSLEATPLAVDGVLYFTASLSVVYAVDAVTGQILWRYDPEAWKQTPRVLRVIPGIHRGVAYGDGAIFVGASDGRLISLDARTGQPNWIVRTIDEPDSRRQISGAPRVFNGKVIIGNAGADSGARGYVTAYDMKTGKQAWRFYTVPGDPAKGFEDETQAMAARTWGGEWWKWGGGGTVWNAITFDREFNRIYIGTGNASNYNPRQRSPGGGDNLFLASIVALDADTGKYAWHYQVNPNEAWDWKATTDMVLADLAIAGKRHKVLMQAPTNGFFYVLDRATGKLLSAEKLGKATWAERIDLATGRPVELPGIRYEDGPVVLWPSPVGVHNWHAMSFSPRTGLVYVPTMKIAATYWTTPELTRAAETQVVSSPKLPWWPIGALTIPTPVDPDDGTGALVAWDPVAQQSRWEVKHARIWNGGTLVTAADLVFQGTAEGWFHAYDATDGKELWKFFAGNGIIAPPITYEVKGVQYVTVLAGFGGAAGVAGGVFDPGWRYGKHLPRVLTFKLGGAAKLPVALGPDFAVEVIDDPTRPIDQASAARGAAALNGTCAMCHGPNAAGGGTVAPDLRGSTLAHDLTALRAVLKQGLLTARGMPQYDDLSDAEIQDLYMGIRQFSRDAKANAPARQQN